MTRPSRQRSNLLGEGTSAGCPLLVKPVNGGIPCRTLIQMGPTYVRTTVVVAGSQTTRITRRQQRAFFVVKAARKEKAAIIQIVTALQKINSI